MTKQPKDLLEEGMRVLLSDIPKETVDAVMAMPSFFPSPTVEAASQKVFDEIQQQILNGFGLPERVFRGDSG